MGTTAEFCAKGFVRVGEIYHVWIIEKSHSFGVESVGSKSFGSAWP